MSIQEQVGYPDYILEEGNKHLDEEYSDVRATHTAPPVPWPQPNPPLSQLPRTLGPQLPGVDPSVAQPPGRVLGLWHHLPLQVGKPWLGGTWILPGKCTEPGLAPSPLQAEPVGHIWDCLASPEASPQPPWTSLTPGPLEDPARMPTRLL